MGVGWLSPHDYIGTYRAASWFRGGSILDLGCGVGRGKQYLGRFDYYGCDLYESVREVKGKVWRGDHHSFRGDFDVIVMSGIFNVGYTEAQVFDVLDTVAQRVRKGFVVGYCPYDGPTRFSVFPRRWWHLLCRMFGTIVMKKRHGATETLVVETFTGKG